MFVTFAAALALASAAPVAAAESPTPAPAESVVEKNDKLVCQTAQVTGTRMAKRKCRTQEELRRQQEANRRKLDNMGERAMKGSTFKPGQ